MSEWALLVVGGLLLYVGAEGFVRGASALALALRIPQIVVGLTVVAYGTSAPELIVGIAAAQADHGDVALGNVLGSNIANVGLILGMAALVRPARVDPGLRRRELPVLLLSTILVPLLLLDGTVSTFEAVALLLVAIGYSSLMVRAARSSPVISAREPHTYAGEVPAEAATASASALERPGQKSAPKSLVIAIVGLLVLLLGGHLFVGSSVAIAQALGMSERIVGLTIVAVGTSLPELVTSIVAARRGHSDLAVGNVVGSNIFNVFLCLGAAALAGTVGAPLSSLVFDVIALAVMTLVALVLLRGERSISRLEGASALALYLAFVTFTVVRG